MGRGLLVSFEGIDRCGKHTQIHRLIKHLATKSVPFAVGREPGDTAYGEAARRLVQDPDFIERLNQGYASMPNAPALTRKHDLNPPAELFGYLIARAMFVEHVARPAIEDGKLFVADRLGDSSVAFQGYGNWHDRPEMIAFIKRCNQVCYGDLRIDRTYLLDLSVEESFRRRKTGGGEFGPERDRIEQREKTYFSRVRQGYLQLAKDEPERFLVIDATKTREEIARLIAEDIDALINNSSRT